MLRHVPLGISDELSLYQVLAWPSDCCWRRQSHVYRLRRRWCILFGGARAESDLRLTKLQWAPSGRDNPKRLKRLVIGWVGLWPAPKSYAELPTAYCSASAHRRSTLPLRSSATPSGVQCTCGHYVASCSSKGPAMTRQIPTALQLAHAVPATVA